MDHSLGSEVIDMTRYKVTYSSLLLTFTIIFMAPAFAADDQNSGEKTEPALIKEKLL